MGDCENCAHAHVCVKDSQKIIIQYRTEQNILQKMKDYPLKQLQILQLLSH